MTANGREVTFTSYKAFNGVVHELKTAGMDYIYARNATLFSEIAAVPRFSLFADYVEKNGLMGPLTSKDFAYTVLVPNNE